MEQLIVIIVFAIYASVCVKIFAVSFIMVNDARDMNHALVAAKNAAEVFRVYGDKAKTVAVLSGHEYVYPNAAQGVVYYDKEWRVCNEAKAVFVLRFSELTESKGIATLPLISISIEKISKGRMQNVEIVSFTVSAKRMHARR